MWKPAFSVRAYRELAKRVKRHVRYDVVHDVQCLGWGILGIRALVRRQLQLIVNVDAYDFQDTVDILDIAGDRRHVAVLKGPDLFFGQHRGQCAHHSTAHRTHQVVESGGMLLFRLDIVKPLNAAVNAVVDRLVETSDLGDSGGAIFSGDRYMGLMYDFAHKNLLFFKF